MHDTARLTGKLFFDIYGCKSGLVLDVGSLDINGTLKPVVPNGMEYCGLDQAPGPNVNVILDNPYQFPFACSEADLVISTSCFEHAMFFWLLFSEMARVVKPGGLIYVSAPIGGVVHRHPVDCWRFYPDAGHALASWAEYKLEPISLIESFILPPGTEGWSDFVAVWAKRPFNLPMSRMLDHLPTAQHRFIR